MWPFKEKIETREVQPFTDAIAQAIIMQASGTLPSNPLTLAALEMAAGCYMRAFMGATIEGGVGYGKESHHKWNLGPYST